MFEGFATGCGGEGAAGAARVVIKDRGTGKKGNCSLMIQRLTVVRNSMPFLQASLAATNSPFRLNSDLIRSAREVYASSTNRTAVHGIQEYCEKLVPLIEV